MISFIYYTHFNGNLRHIAAKSVVSTNKSYLEIHTEHDFQGYLRHKIPFLRLLNWHTNIGYHLLATANSKPYYERTVGFKNIGWVNYRLLHVDYAHRKNGILNPNEIVVGLSLMNRLTVYFI